MTKTTLTTPKGSTVPPGTKEPVDGTSAPDNANGMTDGQGNPASGVTPVDNTPMDSAVTGGAPYNTTGLGANSVDGNNVGGRSVDMGVPAGVVDRLKEQKQREEDDPTSRP